VWATAFSTRQTFSAFSKTDMGKGMVGGTLGGAAMATGLLVGVATALGIAFKALQVAVRDTLDAYENARKTYANALSSGGLPLGFTVRRMQLASVLGVSEKEVFQFGRQVMYLNDKLSWSGQIIAKTTPELARVGWEFKIVAENSKALWATIANKAAPALLILGEAINNFIQNLSKSPTQVYADELKKNKESQAKGASWLKENVPDWYWKVISLISPGASENANVGDKLRAKKVPDPIPPSAYMKQLGASAWEKMGLVVGGHGGINHAAQTARNTAKTVEAINHLRQSLIPRSGQEFFNPAYSNP
jgi:hypothetical protein